MLRCRRGWWIVIFNASGYALNHSLQLQKKTNFGYLATLMGAV